MKVILTDSLKFIKSITEHNFGIIVVIKKKKLKMNIFKLALFLLLFGSVNSVLSQDAAATDSKKPKKETKITEVVNTDSLPSSELLKRAVNWVKLESAKYDKANGVTTGTKAEVNVSFVVKPKELNPPCDYTGNATMKVIIECKDNKYRYTISNIKHVSKSGKTTGGSIDNNVPECGSMIMSDLIWKKIKGECIRCANSLVADIKEGMLKDSKGAGDEW